MNAPLPKAIRQRKRLWTPAEVPPDDLRGYAFPLTKELLGLAQPEASAMLGQLDEARMAIPAVISSINRDYVGDEVLPEGVILDNYRKNPQVFFGHQQLSIGVGLAEYNGQLAVQVEPGLRVLSTCYFNQNTPEGVQFFELVKSGVLRCTSIGFNPADAPTKLQPKDGQVQAGFRFSKWYLLEWSWCGIGMNPDCGRLNEYGSTVKKNWDGATTEARNAASVIRGHLSKGSIGGEKLSGIVRKALEPLAEAEKAWSAGFGKGEKCGGEGSGVPGPCPDASAGGEAAAEENSQSQWVSGERANKKLPEQSRPQLSEQEINEVNQYLSEDTPYYDVNEHLRSGGRLSGDSEVLQDAINKAGVFPEPVTVRRGLQVDDVDEMIEQLKSGSFTDRGFMSTSTEKAFGGNVQFTIEAVHGLDASFYGSNSGELLLPANSDFEVVSMKVKGSKIEARLKQVVYSADKTIGVGNTMNKALAESSGTAGGMTVPDEEMAAMGLGHKRIKEKMKEVALKHQDTADKEGHSEHDLFYHPLSMSAHHTHSMKATAEHLTNVKNELKAIDGMEDVTQSTERPPAKKGWQMVHPEHKQWRGDEPTKPEVEGENAGKHTEDDDATQSQEEPKDKARKAVVAKAKKDMDEGEDSPDIEESMDDDGDGDEDSDGEPGSIKCMKAALCAVGQKYKDAAGEGPHEMHLHTSNALAHHVHEEGAGTHYLKAVRDDMEKIGGIKGVSQGSSMPADDDGGYERIYPEDNVSGGQDEGTEKPDEAEDKPEEGQPAVRTKPAKSKSVETPGQPDPAPTDEGEPQKHGAQLLQSIIEHLQAEMPKVDNPKLQAYCEMLLTDLLDFAKELYPDMEFGGEGDGEKTQTAPDAAAEDKKTQEATADYKSLQKARNKLPKRHMTTIREAADQFGDLSEMQHGDAFTRAHKAACKVHFGALDKMHKDMSGDDGGDMPDETMQAKEIANGEEEKMLLSLIEEVKSTQGKLDAAAAKAAKDRYRLLGK